MTEMPKLRDPMGGFFFVGCVGCVVVVSYLAVSLDFVFNHDVRTTKN